MGTSLTVSPYTPEIMYSGQVQFNVDNYNNRKNLGYATFIRSPIFTVGGYEWTLHYYPDGLTKETEGHVSVALELMGENASALLSLTFAGEADTSAWGGSPTVAQFNNNSQFLFRWPEVRCEVLEQRGLVRNDCLEIQCYICVFRPHRLLKARLLPEIEVPPVDLEHNHGKFLGDQVTADVTVKVGQETFPAHRILLAAQSPVFDRQLFGKMREKDMGSVVVHDMQPTVFRALLYFIYTDSLLDMSGMDLNDQKELIHHLLVAADRYCIERLKNICECILCKCLDMENLLTTVGLAEQHLCRKLQVACVEFLKYSMESDMVASQWYKVLMENYPDVAAEISKALNESRKIK